MSALPRLFWKRNGRPVMESETEFVLLTHQLRGNVGLCLIQGNSPLLQTSRENQAARFRKRVNWGSNRSFTVPTGPLRCLVRITSVMPRSWVSGL